MAVKLISMTAGAEKALVYMARVSNPQSQAEGKDPARLINYLIRNKHWSPFEMVHACFEIETTRDVARQMLRHRSFAFQEFSQRYASPEFTGPREARLQDHKNRQNSLPCDDSEINKMWKSLQFTICNAAEQAYETAVNMGIAKEVARAVLPEGLTRSRLYMIGSFRSWYHYVQVRGGDDTQKEHRLIALEIGEVLKEKAPAVFGTLWTSGDDEKIVTCVS